MIRIGVSSCLLGEKVRWDGGHERHAYLVDILGPMVTWVPVCPEVDSGLPVPRPTMRLERSPLGGAMVNGLRVRLISRTGGDWTDELRQWSAERVKALSAARLDGFVFKRDSPSCGLDRVKVFSGPGSAATRAGRGLFAEAVVQALPHLPVEEEDRLADARVRENFVERVFAYARLRALFAGRWTVDDLARFHAAEELALLAHRPKTQVALTRLVARAKTRPPAALQESYTAQFMEGLRAIATRTRHAGVLRLVVKRLRGVVDDEALDAMRRLAADYRAGRVPLIVPLTLMRHYAARHQVGTLMGQTYLEPDPRELALRNHA